MTDDLTADSTTDPNVTGPPSQLTRWTAADLDRCHHGQHTREACEHCPNGVSTGNLHLQRCCPTAYWIRLGTNEHGEPIYVMPVRSLESIDQPLPEDSHAN